jgi:nitrogen fixation protein NifU and related proteins
MPALYSNVLLDHFRRPRNYGSIEAPDVSHEEFNPLCGDRIRIELKLNQATITEARFKGDGCAISTAAASLLTELLIGTTIEAAASLSDELLIAALESDIQPTRRQCALLALEAVRSGLKEV